MSGDDIDTFDEDFLILWDSSENFCYLSFVLSGGDDDLVICVDFHRNEFNSLIV
jgi:hypothetical protein